jgi:hypothetical protein
VSNSGSPKKASALSGELDSCRRMTPTVRLRQAADPLELGLALVAE